MKKKENKTPSSEIYDDFYFKHACGGHEEFSFSEGETLSSWMSYSLKIAELKPGERVLDLGTGRGEIAYHAAKIGCFSIGLDYSMAAINLAKTLKTKAQNQNILFGLLLSDARFLPFNKDQFDVVFVLDIVEHLAQPDLKKVLNEIYTCLRPGGRLVIHTMPNLNYYTWGYPVYRSLMRLLGRKLPKDPRKRFYHGEVHVNIQSPKTMRTTLMETNFNDVKVNLLQLSGSKLKKMICGLFFLKNILANDIVAIARK
jgi:ubiquinone/menaquinone biosynthesis C-methylase UbiE